jgi:hypothetical protein
VPAPVVASSGVCVHHVHLSSSHSQSYGDAQRDCHVQDDQLGQQVGNAQHGRHVQDDSHGQQVKQGDDEGPSAAGDTDAVRGATKLHYAQSPCVQKKAHWACLQRHRQNRGDGASVVGGAGHCDVHAAARRYHRLVAAALCPGQRSPTTSAAGRDCLSPSRRSPSILASPTNKSNSRTEIGPAKLNLFAALVSPSPPLSSNGQSLNARKRKHEKKSSTSISNRSLNKISILKYRT